MRHMAGKQNKTPGKKLLGELLVDAGLINEYQLALALGRQRQWGGKLGAELIRLGFIEERELAFVLQEQLGIKWISLYDRTIPGEVISTVPKEVAAKYQLIPIEVSGNTVTVATINPNDIAAMDAVSFAIGKKIRPVMALEYDIRLALAKYYETPAPEEKIEVIKTSSPRAERDLEGEAAGRVSRSRTIEKMKMRSPMAQEALIRLLIRKGLFSKEEFFKTFHELD